MNYLLLFLFLSQSVESLYSFVEAPQAFRQSFPLVSLSRSSLPFLSTAGFLQQGMPVREFGAVWFQIVDSMQVSL